MDWVSQGFRFSFQFPFLSFIAHFYYCTVCFTLYSAREC
jgi:hypothetical protein